MAPSSGCSGPSQDGKGTCGRKVVALGLCAAHHQQHQRTGELKPLREGDLVKLPGIALRVAGSTARRVLGEAKRREFTVSAMVRTILDEWARR